MDVCVYDKCAILGRELIEAFHHWNFVAIWYKLKVKKGCVLFQCCQSYRVILYVASCIR